MIPDSYGGFAALALVTADRASAASAGVIARRGRAPIPGTSIGDACSVDGGPRDAEQVAKFGRAVLSGSMQRYEMSFLARVELWLLSAQASFGFRGLHGLPGGGAGRGEREGRRT